MAFQPPVFPIDTVYHAHKESRLPVTQGGGRLLAADLREVQPIPMQVTYHLGAHCTDNDRIVKCLLQNAAALRQEGILVPPVKGYRGAIAETMLKLRHQEITPEIQNEMIDMVLGTDHPKRVILSHDAFLGVPGQALGEGVFYPMLGDKVRRMETLFGNHDVEFCLGLCNPAVFIPDVFARAQETEFNTFLQGCDPMQLRWSELVARLKNAVPNAKIKVWANEDTPLFWPQLLQGIAGHADPFSLARLDDFYAALMSPGGLKRMASYIAVHPPQNEAHYQRIIAAFLDKFALDDVVETEIDLPGWTQAYVRQLSQLYDQDLVNIERIDGVEFLQP